MEIHLIYTDGSCLSNGKATSRAGAGAISYRVDNSTNELIIRRRSKYLGVGFTNQVAEICAAVLGLDSAPDKSDSLAVIFTDSLYVVNTMNGLWSRKANREFWRLLDEAVAKFSNYPIWVHLREEEDGGNERINSVDALAKAASATEIGVDEIEISLCGPEQKDFEFVSSCIPVDVSIVTPALSSEIAIKVGRLFSSRLDIPW